MGRPKHNPNPTPEEAGGYVYQDLVDAKRELQRLMRLVEEDQKKAADSATRNQLRRARIVEESKRFGLDPDFSEVPPGYVPDLELQKQFHSQHYLIASIEDALGVYANAETNPVKILAALGVK